MQCCRCVESHATECEHGEQQSEYQQTGSFFDVHEPKSKHHYDEYVIVIYVHDFDIWALPGRIQLFVLLYPQGIRQRYSTIHLVAYLIGK